MKMGVILEITTSEGDLNMKDKLIYVYRLLEHLYEDNAVMTGDKVRINLKYNGNLIETVNVDVFYNNRLVTFERWYEDDTQFFVYDKINHKSLKFSLFKASLEYESEKYRHIKESFEEWMNLPVDLEALEKKRQRYTDEIQEYKSAEFHKFIQDDTQIFFSGPYEEFFSKDYVTTIEGIKYCLLDYQNDNGSNTIIIRENPKVQFEYEVIYWTVNIDDDSIGIYNHHPLHKPFDWGNTELIYEPNPEDDKIISSILHHGLDYLVVPAIDK